MKYNANYTMRLQELIENDIPIFNFDYDLEQEHKLELQRRFLNKYYFREIGYETYSMWHFKFKEQWINRIKHYKKLFEKYVGIDPLLDFERIKTYVENELGNTDEKTTGSSEGMGLSDVGTNNKQTQKDTPITSFDESNYVSFIGTDNGETNSISESLNTSAVDLLRVVDRNIDSLETETMLTGNQLKRLNDFVNNYIDLNERFVNEFNNLFMGVY